MSDAGLLARNLVEAIISMYVISIIVSTVSDRVGEVITVLATAIGCTASVGLAYLVFAEGVRGTVFHGFLVVDPLSVWGLVTISIVGLAAAVYSVGYLRGNHAVSLERARLYYALFNATMLSMALSALSNNIILLWAAVEATTLATALLVGFYETTTSIEGAWKYAVICGVGVGFALFGTTIVYSTALGAGVPAAKAMLWSGLIANSQVIKSSGVMMMLKLGLLLVVLGYMTKAGLFPVHVWLPDAHAEAPTPISAILSGVIVKCALIAILRWYALASMIGLHSYIANVLLATGILSMVIGGLCVFMQRDIKRLFAYSTVDQVGVIAAAMGTGSFIGVVAAVMHIMYHALAKALAFLGSGLMVKFTGGKRDVFEVGGLLARGLKFTAIIVSIAMLGIIATPPGPSFYSKIYLFFAAAEKGAAILTVVLIGMIVAESSLIYMLIKIVFGGAEGHHSRSGATYSEKGLISCKTACILLAVALITLFVLVKPYIDLAKIVAEEISTKKLLFEFLS